MHAPLIIAFALSIGAASAAQAQNGPRPEYVGPPIVYPSPAPVRTGQSSVRLLPPVLHVPAGEATCGGVGVVPTYSELLPARQGGMPGLPRESLYDFSIGAGGRTQDIRPVIESAREDDALQASLAAWRFASSPRKDCRLTVRWRSVPVEEAETPDLLNYLAVTRDRGALRDAVVKRLGGPGSDCGERFGGRRPDVIHYPDFERGRRPPPGGRSWSVIRWNIAADGRLTDIETLGSSGDADLDAEARRTLGESRMLPGPARTGCVYNLYSNGETLPAPPLPTDRPDDPLQRCPAAIADRFTARANPVFPRIFQDRGIEGWALVRFDVATWGQIGNVGVIEAQPAAAFGPEAIRTIAGGRAEPGFEAGVRCVVPVRFKIQDADHPVDPAVD